jgi:hypothetical protein
VQGWLQFPAMKPMTKWFMLPNRSSRPVWALICLGLFIALQLVAASGPLHQSFHADSSAPDHHCVVTLLSHGQVTLAGGGLWLLAFVAALLFVVRCADSGSFSSFDLRLSPSRAPPRF